jgi:hypothetical protein
MVLVLVLAVAGLGFGVFDGNSAGLRKAMFVRFESSSDGTNTFAVLLLTNRSNQTFTLFKDGNSDKVFGEIRGRISTGKLEDTVRLGGNAVPFSLEPGSSATFRVQLPQTGKVVHLAILYIVPARKVPRLLAPVQLFCWRVFATKFVRWAVCDQEIQCPLLRPDGTVQPPRLLSTKEMNR